MKGSDRGLIEGRLIYQHLPVGTEENHRKLSHDSVCTGQDSNRVREARVIHVLN
jgi:hypothetical protein